MNLQLSGLTAIVTGGTAGIGAAIVKRFAQEGANVIFCSRSQSNVDRMLASLKEYEVDCIGQAIDVTNQAEFDAWIKSIDEADIYIHLYGSGVEYSLSSLFTILHTFDLEGPRKMGWVIKVSFHCLNLHFFSQRE